MFEAFLKRGKLVFILFFIVLIAGGYLFAQLPKRELPEFEANLVTISTFFLVRMQNRWKEMLPISWNQPYLISMV